MTQHNSMGRPDMRIIALFVLVASFVTVAGCDGRSSNHDDAQIRAEIAALRAEIAAQAELDRRAAAWNAHQERTQMAWQARQHQMQQDMDLQAAEQRRAVDEAIRRAQRRGLSHGFR